MKIFDKKIIIPLVIVGLVAVGYFAMIQIVDANKIKVTASVRGWSGQSANVGEIIDLGFWNLKLDLGDVFGPTGSPLFNDQPFKLIEVFEDKNVLVQVDDSLILSDENSGQAVPGGSFLIERQKKTCFRDADDDVGVDLCLQMTE